MPLCKLRETLGCGPYQILVSSIRRIDLKGWRGKNTEMTCVPWEGTLLPSLKLSIPLAPYTPPTLMVLSFLEDIFPTMFPTVIPKEN